MESSQHGAIGYEKIEYTEEQRKLLNELYETQKELNKMFSDSSWLLSDNPRSKEKELELLRKTFTLEDDINESFGIVTKRKFVKMFEAFLSPEMKKEMKSKGYEVVEHPAVPCWKEHFAVQRYFENGTKVDPDLIEYDKDGEVHFAYRPNEISKLKGQYIKEYSKELTTNFIITKDVNVTNNKTLYMLEYYLLATDHYCEDEAKRMANNFCRKLKQD